MIFFQKWSEHSFESKYLNNIRKHLKDNSKKIYLGFDYGFFKGINIYYGSNKDKSFSYAIYKKFIDENINVRLYTNIPYDFDLIILFGYTNQKKERKYLKKKRKKIMKVLSSL